MRGGRGSEGERQGEEDEKAPDHLLQPPAPATQQEVSEDAVPRPS